MKKIKLYDYQQEMLGNVVKVLTGPSLGGFFYNERGKRVKSANSVMVEAFKRGELNCLVNVNLFDEGLYDYR